MFLENNPDLNLIIVYSIAIVFVGSILVIGIIQLIRALIKLTKRSKELKQSFKREIAYDEIFGGASNIVQFDCNLNRVAITILDKEKVNFEMLKELKIGTQITGKVIKCSSDKMVAYFNNYNKQ